jgi:hypothetical protein
VLIVIRPGVQINAIERDTLRANGNRRDVRTHIVVEAVLVHAKVSRRVAQSNEARQELRLRSLHGRHRAAQQNCGSDRLGMSCHSMPIMKREGEKVSPEYRGKCDRYSNGGATGGRCEWPRSLSPGEDSLKKRVKLSRWALGPYPTWYRDPSCAVLRCSEGHSNAIYATLVPAKPALPTTS